jgi:AcrR family transcriptional regulator
MSDPRFWRKRSFCYAGLVKQLSRRPPPRQDRGEAKRLLILDAAERLLEGELPSALTTTAVAEEAGVPIGSLYRYFADKGDLLSSLLERFNAQTLEALEAPNPEAGSWREEVGAVMGVIAEMHQRHPAYGAVAAAVPPPQPTEDPIRQALTRRLSGFLPAAGKEELERIAQTASLIVEAAERQYHLGGRADGWLFGEAKLAIEAYLSLYLD